jgi:hypothetical protein
MITALHAAQHALELIAFGIRDRRVLTHFFGVLAARVVLLSA